MRLRLRNGCALLLLALGLALPLSAQPVASRVAAERIGAVAPSDPSPAAIASLPAARIAQAEGRGLPRWVRLGLVGAAAGAVAFPLAGGLSGGGEAQPARDAAVGALAGFVIIGGSVALWESVCAGDSRSRRAGLCGPR